MGIFKIVGLYTQGEHLVSADSVDEARRQFHDDHPGWEGTVLRISVVDAVLTDDV